LLFIFLFILLKEAAFQGRANAEKNAQVPPVQISAGFRWADLFLPGGFGLGGFSWAGSFAVSTPFRWLLPPYSRRGSLRNKPDGAVPLFYRAAVVLA